MSASVAKSSRNRGPSSPSSARSSGSSPPHKGSAGRIFSASHISQARPRCFLRIGPRASSPPCVQGPGRISPLARTELPSATRRPRRTSTSCCFSRLQAPAGGKTGGTPRPRGRHGESGPWTPGSGALIHLFVAAEFESAGREKSPKFRLPRTEIHIQFSGPDRQPQ